MKMNWSGAVLAWVLYVQGNVFAQECEYQALYTGNSADLITMEEATRTWPEAPELFANWGVKDGMEPPYLRFSGQTNVMQDWTGALNLGSVPLIVGGGNLELQVYSTQSARIRVWLESSAGVVSAQQNYDLPAQKNTKLGIPVSLLGVGLPFTLQKIWVQLDQVPAYQYTTVFMDQLGLTCAQKSEANEQVPLDSADLVPIAQTLANSYVFNNLDPVQAVRPMPESSYVADYAYLVKNDSAQIYQQSKSTTGIVLSAEESNALHKSLAKAPLSADSSRRLWFYNLHALSRARLQDSLFANPQTLYEEAGFIAANADLRLIPLLLADLDYESHVCDFRTDSASAASATPPACLYDPFLVKRYTHVGLPVARVNSSRVALVYDPEFLTTNRKEALPTVELRIDGKWHTLAPKESLVTDLPAAGVHAIVCRFKRGSYTFENTVLVEVR